LREAALSAAVGSPGMYRMSAPTGSGKTLAALAFALAHARQHGLRRVVITVPFLGITAQTAGVARNLLCTDSDAVTAVIEHHSGLIFNDDASSRGWDLFSVRHRLATENWDAGFVITTTVQLFDSLFARNPSSCRKLHRLARSVIVLDEPQCLPVHLAEPITDVLRELTEHYGTTVLMTTATQPAFELLAPLVSLPITEVCPDPDAFSAAFRRVRWQRGGTLSWEEIATKLRAAGQALAVVNTRADAQALVDALGHDPWVLHLSTTMCNAHRAEVLARVADRLREGLPVLLAATQVAEAGLDLDFPVVLRAVAPLPALAQAAGRCNREGHYEEGVVTVIDPADGGLPRDRSYQIGTGVTRTILRDGRVPDAPESTFDYYRRLFVDLGVGGTDTEHVQSSRAALDYPKTADRFNLIDDAGYSVLVRYTDRGIDEHLDVLRSGEGPTRLSLRALQPYLVGLPPWDHRRARERGLSVEVIPGLDEWIGPYSPLVGIDLNLFAREGP
jgi:CRISPR-associated endonuclease/helicase Cas3